MNSNDWHPITELPKPGQKVVALYSDDALTTMEFPGMPFPRVVIAWQPWADPPAPEVDAFVKWFKDRHGDELAMGRMRECWNAALAHAAATERPWKWETYLDWRFHEQLDWPATEQERQAFNAARERKEA